jgi:pimeloyl-ACP methyl ester carboxylesterase
VPRRIRTAIGAHPNSFATLGGTGAAVAADYPHRPRPKDPSGLTKKLRLRAVGRLHWHWDPRLVASPHRMQPPAFTEELLGAAKHVRVPTLLVRGLQSDIVSVVGVEKFRRYVPGFEVFGVAGAGHGVAGDRNDVFDHGVIRFLRRHMSAG